ncbi:DUF6374 family protein [Nocardia sp. NPDC049190]|uniref:DUF6374 family protein n=1 Tax=Nocardia sp. NPDC049190 TaxID=3155650 RepID=UPI0033FF22E5
MSDLAPIPSARMNLEQARERLLAAAAFGEQLTPDQLESLARKVAEGLRLYIEATQNPGVTPCGGCGGSVCRADLRRSGG